MRWLPAMLRFLALRHYYDFTPSNRKWHNAAAPEGIACAFFPQLRRLLASAAGARGG